MSERDPGVSPAMETAPEDAEALSPTTLRAIVNALELLTERVEAIEQRMIETLPPLTRNMEAVDATVSALQSRIEHSGGSLERAVVRLSARLQELESQTGRTHRPKAGLQRFSRGRTA